MPAHENNGLTPDQLTAARRYCQPLFSALRGQGGASIVVDITRPDGNGYSMVAASIRKLRRALYPMSPELKALSDPYREITAQGEAERRRLRAIEYPEQAA